MGSRTLRCLGDANGDNIYEVTVVASDGVNTVMKSLTVKVTDVDEGGKIALSSQDALIGIELTATLTDSDGGVPNDDVLTGVKWQWYSLTAAAEGATSTTAGLFDVAG